MMKFHFSHSKLRKQPFFAKNVIGKCQIFKSREGPRSPSAPPLPTPMVVYSVNAGELISWLTFTWLSH